MDGKILPCVGIFSTFKFGTFLSDDDVTSFYCFSSKCLHPAILRFRIPEVFCRSTGLFVCHYKYVLKYK